MNEVQLIAALHNNEQKAFDQLFDRLFPELCYYAGKLIHDDEDAKDIAAESLSAFWQKEKKDFKNMESVRKFLYTSTRNSCINFIKKQEVRTRHHSILSKQPVDETAMDYAEMETDILQEVYQEIESLPEKCREVFKLCYVEGLKRSEVAKKLNISEHTVKSHNVRALEILRLAFAGKELIIACLLFIELQELGYQNLPPFQLS